MEHLFLYGTLVRPEVLKSIIGREALSSADTLSGYRYKDDAIISGENMYPGIEVSGEFSVDGVVYDVYPEEITLLDQYMGGMYKRKKIRLESDLDAFVYIPVEL